jgi:hypothetical protein
VLSPPSGLRFKMDGVLSRNGSSWSEPNGSETMGCCALRKQETRREAQVEVAHGGSTCACRLTRGLRSFPSSRRRPIRRTMPAGPVARPRTLSRVDLRSQLTFPLRLCFTVSTHAGWIRPRTSFGALPIPSLPPPRYRPRRRLLCRRVRVPYVGPPVPVPAHARRGGEAVAQGVDAPLRCVVGAGRLFAAPGVYGGRLFVLFCLQVGFSLILYYINCTSVF